MSEMNRIPPTSGSSSATIRSDGEHQLSTGELLSRAMEQSSTLVRDEMQLAKTEIQQSLKQAGVGAGLFGAAGIVALYFGGALVATAILALALVVDAWLAALIVTVVAGIVAAVAALMGKKITEEITPPLAATQRNLQRDVETVKESGKP